MKFFDSFFFLIYLYKHSVVYTRLLHIHIDIDWKKKKKSLKVDKYLYKMYYIIYETEFSVSICQVIVHVIISENQKLDIWYFRYYKK